MVPMANGICRPAGDHFTVEMSGNRAMTTFSYDGRFAKTYGDGEDHPEGLGNDGNWLVVQPLVRWGWADYLPTASPLRICIQRVNLVYTLYLLCIKVHLIIISLGASGYAFAISYQSDLSKVTLENLVVFTTKYQYGFTPIFPTSH